MQIVEISKLRNLRCPNLFQNEILFSCLMNECGKALDANEAAIGVDQVEYQNMLKNAFAAMVERLQVFFGKNVSLFGFW